MQVKKNTKKIKEKSLNKIKHNKIKNDMQGITLIALVVTIIVLIILAGVTISLTLNQNGIINKAKEAKQMQLEAEYKEKIGADLLAAYIDATSRNEELEEAQVKDIISNYGELQEDGDTIKIKDEDIEVSLSDIYKGTTTSSGSYTENKAKIAMLEKRVKELQEQLDNLSLSGDEKDKKIAELNSKITELENQKTTLETKVAELEKQIEDIKQSLANAITKAGVETSSDSDIDTFVNNIDKVAKEQYNAGKQSSTLKVQTIGTGNSRTAATFSATGIENYQNLTADNFAVIVNGIVEGNFDSNLEGGSLSISYNPSTGVVSVSKANSGRRQLLSGSYSMWSVNYTLKVYY